MENTILKCYIYCLRDPITLEVKYIGSSKDPKRRMSQHNNIKVQNRKTTKLSFWLKGLFEKGLKPIYEEIEVCSSNWEDREKYWISYYGKDNLCNLSDGGKGVSGVKMSQEKRDIISKTHKGKKKNYKCVGGVIKHTKYSRDKISKSKTGVPKKGRTIVYFKNNIASKIFDSLTEASDFTKDSITSINNNLRKISIKTKNGRYEYI